MALLAASLAGLVLAWSVAGAVLETFTVNTRDDVADGVCTADHCSFREAIDAANANAGRDIIAFALPSGEPLIIRPETPLPPLTDAVVIDATTQPGFAGVPLIELEADLPAATIAFGLQIHGGDSAVRGLRITLADAAAIEIRGPGGNIIQGNYLGTTADGWRSAGNGHGVWIVNSPDNLIGGTTPEERNLISGNLVNGVTIEGPDARGNLVIGNFIGTKVSGTASLPNRRNGIVIAGAPENIIGRPIPGASNVISGNYGTGVRILEPEASGNRVQGNHIGVDVSGRFAIGNGAKGIWIRSPNNLIGGAAPGEGNIISNNGRAGVIIQSPWATGNRIEGNLIGTDITLRKQFGNNPYGVRVHEASNNTVGGREPAQGNVIAHNTSTGVFVTEATGISILSNSIYSNGFFGIDLSQRAAIAGITPNDEGDGDEGANDLQNFPEIEEIVSDGLGVLIRGQLNSQPSSVYLVQLFASARCDGSGHGEGQQLLHSFNTVTDTGGKAAFEVAVDGNPRAIFSATATSTLNSTSEFARCHRGLTGPRPPMASTFDRVDVKRSRYASPLGHNIADLAISMEDRVEDAAFLRFYETSGDLTRWGLPTSEAFEERPGVLVQYFQRGKLEWDASSGGQRAVQLAMAWDLIGGGAEGAPNLGAEPGILNPNPGDQLGPWGHKVSNTSVEGRNVGFKEFFIAYGGVESFGLPRTDARHDSHPHAVVQQPGGDTSFIRQYFQAAVLEFHPNDPESVKVTLIGDVLRDLLYPLESWRQLQPFQPTLPMVAG